MSPYLSACAAPYVISFRLHHQEGNGNYARKPSCHHDMQRILSSSEHPDCRCMQTLQPYP